MSERPTLVIGNKNYSSWSLRPWLLLEHFGVDYEERLLPLGTPQFERDVQTFSPSRRVPALQHGDVSVWDSLAICEYVSETFLDGRGWPRDRAARAHARSIVAEMHSGFSSLRSECPMNVRRIMEKPLAVTDAARNDAARVGTVWREARERYGKDGAFLFGEFSIADAFYAPVVFRFRTYGLPRGDVEQRYMDAVLALPALRAWIAASEAETETIEATERVGRE